MSELETRLLPVAAPAGFRLDLILAALARRAGAIASLLALVVAWEAAARMRSDLSCKLGLSVDQANDLRDRVRTLFNQLVQITGSANETGLYGGGNGNGRSRRARHLVRQEPGPAPFNAQRAGRQRRARNYES